MVSQSELLLATRNLTAIRDHFLPQFHRTARFMESRRVPDVFPNVFYASNGANLLAPSFGGWPVPAGCVITPTFSNCTNRAFAYLSGLTVTYTAMLDRMIELERIAYPQGDHTCGATTCLSLYQAWRDANMQGLTLFISRLAMTNTSYLVRSVDPDGVRHGEFGARVHGYFESSPNVDAVALRVVSDDLARELYASMDAIPQLRPCDFTVPNFPNYDDSCGDCLGYGTWVSGGSWSTVEGRAMLAHFRQGTRCSRVDRPMPHSYWCAHYSPGFMRSYRSACLQGGPIVLRAVWRASYTPTPPSSNSTTRSLTSAAGRACTA